MTLFKENILKKLSVNNFRKLIILASIALFLFASLTFVLAENEDSQSSADNNTNVSAPDDSAKQENISDKTDQDTVDSAPDNSENSDSLKSDESEEKITKDDESAKSKSLSANALLGETIPKALTKQLLPQVNQSSGALIYEYPIVVPPGRNGMQPDLKLSYNNQAAEEGSVFGAGWSINIPYIERINRKGSDKLYTQNYFNSSLSGELLQISGNNWGSKVDNGEFLNYSSSTTSWIVKDKKGTQYTFGSTSGARQDDPNDSTKIYKWMLEEVRDTNNNYIKYEYYKNNNQIYPSKITYTGNGSSDGVLEVNFLRQSSSNNGSIYKTAFNVKSGYRINEINTKVNGTLAHKYVLAYGTGANGARAIMTSITESGNDDSATTTSLPADGFSYQAQVPSWSSAFTISDFNNYDQWGDVNGDGLPDIFRTSSSGATQIYINTGAGWNYDSNWLLPYNPDFGGHRIEFYGAQYNQVIDINGDGLIDIIHKEGGWNTRVYLNNGTGWSYAFSISDLNSTDQFADVNGDGIPDFLRTSPSTVTQVEIGNGSSWTYDSSWLMPQNPDYFNNRINLYGSQYTHMMDVNGDGLTDIINKSNGYDTRVYLNNGAGWTSAYTISDLSNYDRFGDVNNDGLPDLFRAYYGSATQIYINTGAGWNYDSNCLMPYNPNYSNQRVDFYSAQYNQVIDVDGDGLADIIHKSGGYNTRVYLNGGRKIDSLTQITNDKGGVTSVTYKNTTQYMNGGSLLNPKLPMILETAYQISNNDGFGTNFGETYKYEGGEFYFNGSYDRRFSSFAKVTKTDSAGNNTINYYHQGNSTSTSQGEFEDMIAKSGKVYRVEITDGSGNMYSKTINKWDRYNLGNGRSFVKQVQQINMSYDGDSSHKDSAETYTYDDANGNMTQKLQLGEVTGSDNGTYSDTGTDDFTTAYSFATGSSSLNILGLISDVTVTDHNSTKVKQNRYYYDSQSLGTVTKGNETKHEMWKDASNYINTQKTFDGTYGLVTQTTDANGKNTGYSYDTYNLYPEVVTDPLSHSATYLYDYSSGQVKQKTDANSRVFQYVFDGLDRLVTEKQPDMTTPATLVNKTEYTYTDTSGAVKVKQSNYPDASSSVDMYSYFDGFGRKLQERKQAESSNYEAKDYLYNNLGLLYKESLPYFSSGTSRTGSTTTSSLYIIYSYDPLYRLTSTVDAVGTVANTYADWKLTINDKRGKNKDLYKDAYGNLVRVDEHNSTSTYSTYYDYNGLGALTKITDALSNIRNFSYDGLGRKLSAQDLHASADTSYGVWNYSYDNNGNLTSSTNPNAKTVNYTYDDTNRVLTENYTGQAGTEVTYVYDTGTDGIGRLYSVTTPSSTQTNAYNALGNLVSEDETIASNTYTTTYTYDRQGNQLIITNPDNSKIKYDYGAGGLLNQVSRKESSDGSYSYVVSNIDYSPTEQPTAITYANGMSTTNSYDASNLYRLTSKLTTIASSSKGQDIAYTYDGNNNITNLTDNSDTHTKKTVDYVYDDLNRLSSATATNVASGQSTYTENFAYNAIGNIISKTGQGSYSYAGDQGASYANPHAVTSVGSTTLAYDNAGNLLTKGSVLSNTWDYNNRLTQTVASGVTDSYAYDASGTRISISKGTSTIAYPTKFYNSNGSTPTKHVFANGTEIASITGTGGGATVHYTATDHLTGSNIVTNASNVQEELLDYMPFGSMRFDEKAGAYDGQRKFIGQEYDADSGLSCLQARHYDSLIGKFISQDPVFVKPDSSGSEIYSSFLVDPQSQNSYSYAKNNPMTLSDPDGRFAGVAATVIGTLVMYAPQIISFVESLSAPIGQYGLAQAGKDAQKGNYGWAVVGAITSGDFSAGKALVNGIETTSDVASFLNKASAPTDVYLGVDKGKDVYVGITKNTAVREMQHGERFSEGLKKIANLPTRNQSRALEQVIKDANVSSYQNIRNSISPKNPLFSGIKEWGAKAAQQLGISKR